MEVILSIIIPVYNVENYIHRTIESLIRQNSKEVEYIIVDDGSTDNSVEVVKKTFQDNLIKNYKIITKSNGGVSSARNVGIKNSRGKYVYFLDGDDYVSHNFFNVLLPTIKDYSSDIISWEYNKVDIEGASISRFRERYSDQAFVKNGIEALSSFVIDETYGIWTCSAVYKKRFLEKYGVSFTEGCSNGEDLEFIFKSLSHANEVRHINEVLSFYLQRSGSVINSFNINKFDSICALYRASDYLLQTQPFLSKEIANEIEKKLIPRHYIQTVMSYFYFNDEPREEELFNSIDIKYPRLRSEVIKIMKDNQGFHLFDRLKTKLFICSPILFFKLYEFKKKIDALVKK